MDLAISDIVNVSVSKTPTGVGAYNTSNIALFSHESYDANTFGAAGYKIYLSPNDVETDFGSDSVTYKQALGIFSQQPNMLAGGGYLVIIPIIPQTDDLALSGVAASGTFELVFSGGTTAAINWNDNAAAIQTKVQAVTGQTNTLVTGSIASRDLKIQYMGQYGDVTPVTVTSNSLQTSGAVAITFTITSPTAAEEIDESITRTIGLVQYFGVIGSLIFTQADMLAAAAVIQAQTKIAGFVSRTTADFQTGGMLDLLRSGDFDQSRGLYYGSDNDTDALVMLASYFGRALSTNFSGSNTTQTMQLKDLIGVQPDPSMTETLLTQCGTAGVDVYASVQGIAKVLTSGANSFFDQVYNRLWFVGAIQVAAVNFLAQSSTKVPQTENAMDGFKGALRVVANQAVGNQYVAPGTWNSPNYFGNQNDFLQNIAQRGYYIYSTPIALQSQTDRAARKAPLVQIAIKEAGAIHSASVIVNINA